MLCIDFSNQYEENDECYWRNLIPLYPLFRRITDLTAIQLLPRAVDQLKTSTSLFEFVDSDVVSVSAKPRFMDIIDFSGAFHNVTELHCVHVLITIMLGLSENASFVVCNANASAEGMALMEMSHRKSGNERQRLLSMACVKVCTGQYSPLTLAWRSVYLSPIVTFCSKTHGCVVPSRCQTEPAESSDML